MLSALFLFGAILAIGLFPKQFSAQRRKGMARVASFFVYFGGVIILCGLFSLAWGYFGLRAEAQPPSTPIAADTLAHEDLSGKLNEALVSGVLQLDERSTQQFRYGSVLSFAVGLIPLTSQDWVQGDPVRVFVASNRIIGEMTQEQWRGALLHESLPLDSSSAVAIEKLMAAKVVWGTDASDAATLRSFGLNVTDDVLVLEIIQGRRAQLLQRAYDGFTRLFNILAVMGAVLLTIGLLLRFSMRRAGV